MVDWHRAIMLTRLGRLDEAHELYTQYVQAPGGPHSMPLAHRSVVATLMGDTARALEDALAAKEAAEKLGSSLSLVAADTEVGVAFGRAGRWEDAVEALERALSRMRETGANRNRETARLAHLADAHLGCGNGRRARGLVDEAIELAQRQGARVWECFAHIVLGRVLSRTEGADDADRIRVALDGARQLAEEMGHRPYEAQIREEYARLGHLVGDDAASERHLREAHRLYTEMGATGHAERLARELDS
jgi:tetratricopeptide (TPR) repeat protein